MPNSHGNAIPFSGDLDGGNVAGGAQPQPALSQRLDVWVVQSSVRLLQTRAPQRQRARCSLPAAPHPPAHPDRRPRVYKTLKVSFPGGVSKVCPAPRVSSRPPGQAPGNAACRSSLLLPWPPALLLGHSDRSTFTSMCSWQRKQKKASSLIIKRHLRLISKPRGPRGCPTTRTPTTQLEGGPHSEAEFLAAPESPG